MTVSVLFFLMDSEKEVSLGKSCQAVILTVIPITINTFSIKIHRN